MVFLRLILFPVAIIYGIVTGIRNLCFNFKILPTTKIDVRVISVGNLSVGGTGKTPHVEFLAGKLSETMKTAVLLRGYGRKSKGFLRVTPDTKVELSGDEALNYTLKLSKDIEVAVCENRVKGAVQLLKNNPDLDFIVLDDAYQHRYIFRDCNILLTEFNRPFFKDYVVPAGRLREFSYGKNRADIILVTKTPYNIKDSEKTDFIRKMQLKKEIPCFFSTVQYGQLSSLKDKKKIAPAKNILLVTGIANPTPLKEYLEQFSNVTHLKFDDHYSYTLKKIDGIHKIFDNFANAEKIIVTTEKDAVRLRTSELNLKIQSYPWYCQEMCVNIEKEDLFLKYIYGDIE